MKKYQKRQKRLVLVAMVLMIGLVAGMGAMTYSKYITTAESENNQATAAKWGYTITVDVSNLFGEGYAGTGLATVVARDDGVSAKVDTEGSDIVAPGTTGYMTISISGQAEVASQLTFTFDNLQEIFIDTDNDGVIDPGEYAPIKWSLVKDVSGVKTNLVTDGTLLEVQTKLNGLTSAYIEPNATPEAIGTYTLSWKWVLENGTGDELKQNNVKDTAIGFKAANLAYNDVKLLNIGGVVFNTVITTADLYSYIKTQVNFDVAVSIEQIQKDPTP